MEPDARSAELWASCAFFTAIFLVSQLLWRRFSLSKADRGLLASSTMSAAHGIPSALLSLKLAWEARPLAVDATNSRQQQWLLQFSLAYMLCDTVLYLLPYTPTDYIFLAHHAVASLYLATSRSLGRGAASCLVMLLLGECTSGLQNAWYVCRTLQGQGQAFARQLRWLRVAYPVSYAAVRSVVGPPAVLWLCWQIARAQLVPAAYRAVWVAVCLVSLAGSQLWSLALLRGLFAAEQGGARAQS